MLPAPRFETIAAKRLIGMCKPMSFAHNTTAALWQAFMPRRQEVTGAVSHNLYSLQAYPADFWQQPDMNATFEKYALVEVNEDATAPDGMQMFTLQGGLYAVFFYKGHPAHHAPQVFGYIFNQWLPSSGYILDDRPHFEVLGEKYNNTSPESEEEIWIPVRHAQI